MGEEESILRRETGEEIADGPDEGKGKVEQRTTNEFRWRRGGGREKNEMMTGVDEMIGLIIDRQSVVLIH